MVYEYVLRVHLLRTVGLLTSSLRIPRADRRQATEPVEAEEKPECGGGARTESVSVAVANNDWIIMPQVSRELTSFSSKLC